MHDYTIDDAAAFLRLTPRSVVSAVRNAELRAAQGGERISAETLQTYRGSRQHAWRLHEELRA